MHVSSSERRKSKDFIWQVRCSDGRIVQRTRQCNRGGSTSPCLGAAHQAVRRPYSKLTKKALHQIIRCAAHMHIVLHVWVSIPCTAGCRWMHINSAKGRATGDIELTNRFIEVAIANCLHTHKVGGHVSWEWPSTCALWKQAPVSSLFKKIDAVSFCISTAAIGLCFDVKGNVVHLRGETSSGPREVGLSPQGASSRGETSAAPLADCNHLRFLKKKWLVKTTCQKLRDNFAPYSEVPKLPSWCFIECRGKVAEASAKYPIQMAYVIWKSIMPARTVAVTALLDQYNSCDKTLPDRPLWCSMITRKLSMFP